MGSFATMINGILPVTIDVNLSILDVCEGHGYASWKEWVNAMMHLY